MQTLNSRIITYPSKVEKNDNHTVVLIDATDDDIERIALLLETSFHNFDVYLYEHNMFDLDWLRQVTDLADKVLRLDESSVIISNCNKVENYQPNQMFRYFEHFDQNKH